MFARLAQWLRAQVRAALAEYHASSAPPVAGDTHDTEAALEQLSAAVESLQSGMTDALDIVRKSSRAQARIGIRIDEIERRMGAPAEPAQRTEPPPRWDALWDAMDVLDLAIAGIAPDASGAELRTGLTGVATRLHGFLAEHGMSREVPRGIAPDGRVVRVVGTEDVADVAEGAVIRVVRAPVIAGDRVLREGEVITCRRSS
jgi:molecular chaperone GrpE (heat shock protein)